MRMGGKEPASLDLAPSLACQACVGSGTPITHSTDHTGSEMHVFMCVSSGSRGLLGGRARLRHLQGVGPQAGLAQRGRESWLNRWWVDTFSSASVWSTLPPSQLGWGPGHPRLRLHLFLRQHPALDTSPHPAGGAQRGGGGAGLQVPLLSELPGGLRWCLAGTHSCCGEKRGAVSPLALSGPALGF